MRLFIDDERKMPEGYTDIATTVAEAINKLKYCRQVGEELELVSFDYDAHSHLSWTFESVAEWMLENECWPAEIRIHTLNSWHGRPWYEEFFTNHAPQGTIVDTTDPWSYLVPDADSPKIGDAPAWVIDFGRIL